MFRFIFLIIQIQVLLVCSLRTETKTRSEDSSSEPISENKEQFVQQREVPILNEELPKRTEPGNKKGREGKSLLVTSRKVTRVRLGRSAELSRRVTDQDEEDEDGVNKPLAAVNREIRMNFDEEVASLINDQINLEFRASYIYLSMSAWFAGDNQALTGFAKLFKGNSDEERDHGIRLINYMAERGGTVQLQTIDEPNILKWGTPTQAFKAALGLEKAVNQALLDLHTKASEKGDAHLTNFLEEFYLTEQVKEMKKIGDMLTRLDRAGEGIGLHILDQELLHA
ncbi:ferritin heavy chain A isoform X1 [Eurytemora carolleeae]|uniref:ferritin heavy chain A isoform X1 n=1 Tax=Eurytemora carolleeae TaxID=1294199 RepID=UPI000C770C77|nr:ferritin heavy chain A isoform X1 [Eurytemora carolleeae]|eukprot:XP_023331078.1 ferritin heavy chain A-like isoform X1 [Eurytemora affinis]